MHFYTNERRLPMIPPDKVHELNDLAERMNEAIKGADEIKAAINELEREHIGFFGLIESLHQKHQAILDSCRG